MPLSGFESLKPLDVNFDLYIGESFSANIVVRLDNGTPINLLSSTVSTKMENSEFTTPIALVSQITNAAQGIVTISLVDTSALSIGRYGYSAVLSTTGGLKIKIAEGFISVR